MLMTSVSLRFRRQRATIALLAGALLITSCGDATSTSVAQRQVILGEGLPVVMSVRAVCRLAADSPSAVAAGITGVDGTQSVVAGPDARSYWFFGDTVRQAGGRQEVIPAAMATTTDVDASDCLDLEFKTAPDGLVTAMFPRLDETTAWPDGVFRLQDGTIYFYLVKAYRQSPFAWHVGSVGLGRIPSGSTDGERLVETVWDERSGFGARVAGARSPVRVGDDVVVYLALEDGRNVVAKAPGDRIGEPGAYTYWDGEAWSSEPREAAAMWTSEDDGFPPDNGVQVTFDERAGTWVALYNDGMASVKVRIADQPWGSWSEPITWFDCLPLVEELYPFCYTGELHRHLTRGDGLLYMTISSQKPYDVTLLELHMGQAIHEWRARDGVARYAATAPAPVAGAAEFEDAGVAFYASGRAAPGLSAVYETPADGGGYRYGTEPPSHNASPAFYAYGAANSGPIRAVAVRETGGSLTLAPGPGEVRFFVPCPVAACEELSAAK
jgi:hypothetical protein